MSDRPLPSATRPLCVAALTWTLTTLSAPPAHAAAGSLPAPWTVVPWGAGVGAVSFDPGADERPAVGPTALAVAPSGEILIADPVGARVVVVGSDGRVARQIDAAALALDDLRVTPDGEIVALDARLDRVQRWRPGARGWRADSLPAGVRPRALAIGPAGAPWIVGADGAAHALAGGDSGARATPLGAGVPSHALGRRFGPDRGAVLVWPWARAAEPKDVALKVLVTRAGRLGLVRPIAGDGAGRLYVLVETVAAGAPTLDVGVEVLRVGADGRVTGHLAWSVDDAAPAHRAVDVGADGTAYVMRSLPAGLALWRIPPAAWPAPEAEVAR